MNKRMIFALLAILMVSTALYAGGAREQGGGILRDGLVMSDVKEITVTGPLEVTSDEVSISDGTARYSLSVRGGQWLDLSAQDGTVVTLTGTVIEDPYCEEDVDGHVFVTTAQIGGETFTFDAVNAGTPFGYGKQGQMGGRMGLSRYQQPAPRTGSSWQSPSYGRGGFSPMQPRGGSERQPERGFGQGRYL